MNQYFLNNFFDVIVTSYRINILGTCGDHVDRISLYKVTC